LSAGPVRELEAHDRYQSSPRPGRGSFHAQTGTSSSEPEPPEPGSSRALRYAAEAGGRPESVRNDRIDLTGASGWTRRRRPWAAPSGLTLHLIELLYRSHEPAVLFRSAGSVPTGRGVRRRQIQGIQL